MNQITDRLTESQRNFGIRFKDGNNEVIKTSSNHCQRIRTAPGVEVIATDEENPFPVGTIHKELGKWYAFWVGTDPETCYLGAYNNPEHAINAIEIAYFG